MKVTKNRGTTVVEISKGELMKYNLTFEKMDCSQLHTVTAIKELLLEATGKECSGQKEIILLPDCHEGCVIVCKEKERQKIESFSFSTCSHEKSEIFCGFFS